ncbi:uroporphyrinogen-III synthase [Apiospora kogelbergensis]|uniref:Uroporphyrinogen-III synthase n=1 Tax=Apiospora kogelbergensis TaxID=1337665 RepID=A0AAW0QK61_9PEZI
MSGDGQRTPVLLLKTRSGSTDAYHELFSTPRDGFDFEPAFVPVLQHRFDEHGLQVVRELLHSRKVGKHHDAAFGGLIFTSQRAVEAFGNLVEEGQALDFWPHLQHVPVYSVGPATTRALKAIHQSPPLQIFGEHTGNGDALARFILEHYSEWYSDRPAKPPLLFLVGEQRRDVIPKTLMDPTLLADRRINVTETVVYGTGVMESFPNDLKEVLRQTSGRRARWVVVFSPTGCGSMLRGLDMLKEGDQVGELPKQRTTFIATIGPTTRDYLKRTFGYEPDVCAERPSPEGIWEGITRFNATSI